MTSIETFPKKNTFKIQHQIDAYQSAARWQEQAMRHVVKMTENEPDTDKAIATAQKSLNKNHVIPRHAKRHADERTLHWKHVDKRRIYLKKKISELVNSEASDTEAGLAALQSYFTAYANCIPEVLRGIGQLCLNMGNANLRRYPALFFKQYKDEQYTALHRFMMKSSHSMPMSERAMQMDITMQELSFLLAEIESEWNLWQVGIKHEYQRIPKRQKRRCEVQAGHVFDDALKDVVQEQLPEGTCGFQLCNPDDIQGFLELSGDCKQRLIGIEKDALEKLKRYGGMAALATVPMTYRDVLSGFRARFPNMVELADLIEGALNLSTLGGTDIPLQLSSGPIILSGPPGTGKTIGLRYLSERLGVAFTMIGCAELTNGFDISGMSRGWGTSKPGMIARMLIRDKAANGIVVLDELDKCHDSQSNFPPTQALFTLFERETATHFKDEYFDFEMDASRINWMVTANDYKRIPEPLRDRATNIRIGAPTLRQRVSIAGYLYQDLCRQNNAAWGKYFAPDLDPSVAWMVASLEGVSIRGMKRALMSCLTAAAGSTSGVLEEGSLHINENDAVNVLGACSGRPEQSDSNGLIH